MGGIETGAEALTVYTDPSLNQFVPNFNSVSRQTTVPVYVGFPSGQVNRYTKNSYTVYRGEAGSC
jgi:hypothetical protein